MNLTISELKDLILYAREHKLKSLKVGEIAFEISEIAHISESTELDMGTGRNKAVTASLSDLIGDSQLSPEEEEELLFHSARP